MDLKKCLISTLAAATLLGATAAGAYQTEGYGSRSFRTVSVPMDGSVMGRVVTADGLVVSDQPAASIINANAGGQTVNAAINGLFFNSYYKPSQPISFPDNTPLILSNIAINGQSILGNGKCNAIGFTQDGRAVIDVVEMTPKAYVDGGTSGIGFWSVNGKHGDSSAVILITDRMNLPYSIASGSTAFLVQNGTVTQELHSGSVTLAPGQSLMVFNPNAASTHAGWGLLPHVGSSIRYETEFQSNRGDDWSRMNSMTGGGRMLVYNGQVVSADPSYNQGLDYDPKQSATSVAMRSFAAVMNNGTLLLGTGTGSFNEIAQFLQAKGATEAVSLDGGASSMLYENGSFVTNAGRELASILMFTSAPKPVAYARPCQAMVDGSPVSMDAYSIENNNYVRLRDLACAVSRYSDSDKVFNVEWNNDRKAVELTAHEKYDEKGGELTLSQGQNVTDPALSRDAVYMNGSPIELKTYKINNTNYVKLRDVYRAFDIQVGYDSSTKTVLVNTAESYSE